MSTDTTKVALKKVNKSSTIVKTGKHQSIKSNLRKLFMCTINSIYKKKKTGNNNTHSLWYISVCWSTVTCMGMLRALRVPLRSPFKRGSADRSVISWQPHRPAPLGTTAACTPKPGQWLNTAGFQSRAAPTQWTPLTSILVEIFSKLHCRLRLLDSCQSSFSVFLHRFWKVANSPFPPLFILHRHLHLWISCT